MKATRLHPHPDGPTPSPRCELSSAVRVQTTLRKECRATQSGPMTRTSRTIRSRDLPIPQNHRTLKASRIRSGLALITVAAIVALTTNCSTTTTPTQEQASAPQEPIGYQLPREVHIFSRWLPPDVLDLNTPDATFVRAFVESTTVAFFGGGAEHAYPGFVEAMQPAVPADRYLRTPRDGYGVDYFRITGFVELDGDRARVTGCKYSPSAHPNTPVPNPNEFTKYGIAAAFSITYQRQGQSPPASQRGGQRAPAESVFGDWRALEYIADLQSTEPEALRPCIGQEASGDPFAPSPGWPTSQPHV